MKKVLMTAKHLDAGGVETFITGIYPYIDKEKYHIDFVISKKKTKNDPKGYFEDDLVAQGAKIYRIAPKSRHFLQSCRDLKKILKEHPEYEIFHINDGGGAAIPLMVARMCGIKNNIVHAHNSSSKIGQQNIIMKLFRSYVVRTAKLVACAEDAGSWMFGKKADVEVLHYGIDTRLFAYDEQNRKEVREELNIREGQFLIGHVGRFNVQKNHAFLIEIFKEVCRMIPDAKLLLIGTGELETDIRNKVDELKLQDNVIFLGTTKQVYKYLSAMDLLLFPSLFEGFGIAHIEAQCNGLSCILSDTLTKECKITDKVKMLSLRENAEFWASTVVKALRDSDTDNRGEYEHIMREKGFDRKQTAEHLEQIYERIIL